MKRILTLLCIVFLTQESYNQEKITIVPIKKENEIYGGFLYGFKDKNTGEQVVNYKYKKISEYGFKEGMLAVMNDDDNWGFINEKGKEVISPQYKKDSKFLNGLAYVIKDFDQGMGAINKTGQTIIPFKYFYISYFTKDKQLTSARDFNTKKWGFINKHGDEVISFKYEERTYFSNKIAKVKLNDKYGFINLQNQIVIPIKYDEIESFYDNSITKAKLNDKWGYINKFGDEVISIKYDGLGTTFYNGLLAVKLNDKWGYVNNKGKVIIPIKYEEAKGFDKIGLAPVKSKGKWAVINKKNVLLTPFKYDKISSYRANRAAVKLNGKWGYINQYGKIAIPIKYDRAEMFYPGGITGVTLKGKRIYINTKGQQVKKPY